MKLIQIQEGITINADRIDGIEDNDKTCYVYIGGRKYESTYPYSTLIQLLKSEEVISKGENKDMVRTMQKVEAVLEKTGHFAG